MSEASKDQGAGIIIASDNINQRQAIAVAVTKGLADAGFTNVIVAVDKSDDPSRVDITSANAETLLGSMRLLNPQLFDEPISILAAGGSEGARELVADIAEDMRRDEFAMNAIPLDVALGIHHANPSANGITVFPDGVIVENPFGDAVKHGQGINADGHVVELAAA
jgi:hypothetical protein